MIMVRRRGRAVKEPNMFVTSNGAAAPVDAALPDEPLGAAVALAGAQLLEDQYFASPKRKDCRLMLANENLNEQDQTALASNHNKGKATKTERACSAGRTIGVPLATRSQTRTIENFFKAKAAANDANKTKESAEEKTIYFDTTKQTDGTQQEQLEQQEQQDVLLYEKNSLASSSSSNYQLILEDEEHIEQYELSEPTPQPEENLAVDHAVLLQNGSSSAFQTHRSSLRDSHSSSHSSSSTTTTDNIFLQEPVLTLDIDRSLIKASSIKINKSFELASAVFSSPPSALSAACMLNGRFNQIVTLNGQCEPQPINFMALPQPLNGFDLDQHDCSSCDSGVASTLTNAESPGGAAAPARRRKPATPHRILCPSPIKTLPRDHNILLPGARKMAAATAAVKGAGDALSPRKSPRKLAAAAAACKSRRRLNTPKPQAPYATQQLMLERQTATIAVDDVVIVLDDDVEDEDEDDVHALLRAAAELENRQKAMKNNNHNHVKAMIKPAAPKKPSSKGAKPKGPASALPLAATNGNREISEFFPVRRSVRKTKSAVKEEMMRNLEQAVLEERAEGLAVRNFEGKGRGVVADRHFKRNEFVVEYVGDLISISEATERERKYALDENAGCYMYYFKHKNQQYCIDATVDTGKLGRLINHSRTGNLMTKVVVIKQRPHLVLLAKDDILPGEELTYDYGDRSKEALIHHPWLAF